MPVKELIARLARKSGALRVVRDTRWRRDRLLVLCYHGVSVSDEHEWSPELYVTPDHLRRRLALLRDGGYRVLPLTEALTRLAAGSLPPRSVAITFDDGTADFASHAVPILTEFAVPVTLYLTTHYVTKRVPVFDPMLSYVLWKGRSARKAPPSLPDVPVRLETGSAAARLATWHAVQNHAMSRGLSTLERDELLLRVAGALGVDYDAIRRKGTLQLMSPEQIRQLPHELVDVQLHTHRHRVPHTEADFMREIRDNAMIIASLRGADRPLEHFAYPSGIHSPDALVWLRECGVRFATTCDTDLASRASNPMLLPRFTDTMLQSSAVFESWASGFQSLLPRRPQPLPFDPLRATRTLSPPTMTRHRRPASRANTTRTDDARVSTGDAEVQ